MVLNARVPEVRGDVAARTEELARLLTVRLTSGAYDDTLLHESPEAIADRMTAVLGETRHPVSDRVGPVYTTPSLTRWKGVSKQAIHNAVKERRLLGFKTADGVWLYPAFQFGPHGEYLPDLPRVLALLDPNGDDPTTAIVWLNEPDTGFSAGGTTAFTAAELLRDGRTKQVLAAAAEVRDAWAS